MAPEVLDVLIYRQPEIRPHEVAGWRVAELDGKVYPGLVLSEGSTATGALLTDLQSEEWAVLDAFEDAIYDVRLVDDGSVAYTCPLELALSSSWDFGQFTQTHLGEYVGRCRQWRTRYDASR